MAQETKSPTGPMQTCQRQFHTYKHAMHWISTSMDVYGHVLHKVKIQTQSQISISPNWRRNLRENTSIATRRQVPFIQVMAIGTNTKNEIDANVQTLWIRDEEGHIPWRFQVKWNSYGNWTIQELKIFAILGHFQSLPQEFQRYR